MLVNRDYGLIAHGCGLQWTDGGKATRDACHVEARLDTRLDALGFC